jgi:ribosomal protein L11 methyltransferase
MSLLEFELRLDADAVDAMSDALLDAGALSVSVEDAEADTAREQPLYGEPGADAAPPAWRCNRVRVLIARDAGPDQVLAQAAATLGIDAPAIDATREIADADWVRLTQAQFEPIAVGRLWIVPTWHEPPDPLAPTVRLDPGIAFGTGSHPTTRLCLTWLERNLRPGASVLDYGCGSGILAIAAARLGAGDVVGTDIDPQALEAARRNSDLNGVPARYTAPDGLAALPARRFDVVVANILASPLMLLAPSLAARVAPLGSIVLSGVLERQAEAVIAAYRGADAALALAVWRRDGEWVCIVGRRGV